MCWAALASQYAREGDAKVDLNSRGKGFSVHWLPMLLVDGLPVAANFLDPLSHTDRPLWSGGRLESTPDAAATIFDWRIAHSAHL